MMITTKEMDNKLSRIFGTFFLPALASVADVRLGSLTMAETTNLSEPYLANSMIR